MSAKSLFFALLFTCCCMACEDDDVGQGGTIPPPPPPEEPAVNVDLAQMPFERLSEYNFFVGDDLSALQANEGLLLYKPISSLFSDYAHKIRYVWLPEGRSASRGADDKILNFPDGTVILKTFFYDNVLPTNERRIIETRMLYKMAGEWKFAEYVWNEEQSEATLDLSGSRTLVEFINNDGEAQTVNYRVPSEAVCLTCHKTGSTAIPIGPKPQNLNAALDYPDGSNANQLSKWHEVGYLQTEPDTANINTVVNWDDQSADLTLRVRSYLDINCAHCHREGGHCDYRDIRLAFSESGTAAALGICVPPEEFLDGNQRFIVNPGTIDQSALFFRLNSTAEEVRMPLLGRSLQHKEGLAIIESWINELENNCD